MCLYSRKCCIYWFWMVHDLAEKRNTKKEKYWKTLTFLKSCWRWFICIILIPHIHIDFWFHPKNKEKLCSSFSNNMGCCLTRWWKRIFCARVPPASNESVMDFKSLLLRSKRTQKKSKCLPETWVHDEL